MCWICGSLNSIEHLLWTRGTTGAGWRPTIRTHDSYVAELVAAGKEVPVLYKIKGLRHEGVMVDILHAVDQGGASHVAANVFIEVNVKFQFVAFI